MALQIADRWFDWRRIDDDITFLWEPHVTPLMRCNIWHVRGRDRDLLVDTGMGVMSLREAARDIFDKPVTAVATHAHSDHIGSHHEFEERVIHRLEAQDLAEPYTMPIDTRGMSGGLLDSLLRAGYEVPPLLIDALPHDGYDMDSYAIAPAPPTRLVEDGSIIDIGGRSFEVLHLPGHSPGSIGLWEEASGILFSGDALYDGPLLDELEDSSIPDYVRTMKRLREIPVRVVHAGHDPSFGRERLIELVDQYLERRDS
jgi:glyoxylase-like metal-dependent hydrolase (beta-lactamase superfamily II)